MDNDFYFVNIVHISISTYIISIQLPATSLPANIFHHIVSDLEKINQKLQHGFNNIPINS